MFFFYFQKPTFVINVNINPEQNYIVFFSFRFFIIYHSWNLIIFEGWCFEISNLPLRVSFPGCIIFVYWFHQQNLQFPKIQGGVFECVKIHGGIFKNIPLYFWKLQFLLVKSVWKLWSTEGTRSMYCKSAAVIRFFWKKDWLNQTLNVIQSIVWHK